MKPNMQRKGNILETSKVKKGTNRQKRPALKASGVLPFSDTEVPSGQLSVSKPSIGTNNQVKLQVDPLAKIKLQLFPVDEVTRIGLEKDGHNPFLELTLKARKKISSVIKHIHTKWGGSHIAIGDPVLLPYDTHHKHLAMSRRWTTKDTVISAGDVYTELQSPAVFRLSYGWFSDHGPKRFGAATTPLNCIISEKRLQKEAEIKQGNKCVDATAEVAVTANVDTDDTNLSMGGLLSTDISIGGLLSEASLQGKLHNNEVAVGHQQTPIRWDDSLTALSIGGLLSEASMQAKVNNNNNKTDTKSNEKFVSDSFDAIISSQVMKPSSLDSRSSILDAEETCHAFSFRKMCKNVRVSARATQDLSSNSFRFPHLQQDDKKAEDPEPKTELFPRPQPFGEDSRSLGLRGLTWNESLGPFDLGNSMPWKVPGGSDI